MLNNLRKALKDFLNENGVRKEEEYNAPYRRIMASFSTYKPYDAIDSFSWTMDEKSYYFWYFLQLKWIRFLILNRKTFNLEIKTLIDKLEYAISYSHDYWQVEDIGQNSGFKADYSILKEQYKRLVQKYKEFLKNSQE